MCIGRNGFSCPPPWKCIIIVIIMCCLNLSLWLVLVVGFFFYFHSSWKPAALWSLSTGIKGRGYNPTEVSESPLFWSPTNRENIDETSLGWRDSEPCREICYSRSSIKHRYSRSSSKHRYSRSSVKYRYSRSSVKHRYSLEISGALCILLVIFVWI